MREKLEAVEKAKPKPTFKPKIDKNSVQILNELSYLDEGKPEERLYSMRELKSERFNQLKSQLEEEFQSECTFKPTIDDM